MPTGKRPPEAPTAPHGRDDTKVLALGGKKRVLPKVTMISVVLHLNPGEKT